MRERGPGRGGNGQGSRRPLGKLPEPADERGNGESGGKPKPIPWRRIFRDLSEAYGWTPDQIGELTLAQVHVYYLRLHDSGDSIKMEPGEASRLRERAKKQRAAYFDRWLGHGNHA